jgi:phosphoenolpyruvate carboxykinase (ATP)
VELQCFNPDWTIVDFGHMSVSGRISEIPGEAVIALNFADRQVLIAGTEYAGEMKKSVFTLMNYLLPINDILSMHCSANIGPKGDSALFFGLSGTGKTTLSTDPVRRLIGDDEHGWTDSGVFNIEGGCYAKCIDLDPNREPEIWSAIRHGAIVENVVFKPNGDLDFKDRSITENTRVAYPLEYIPNAVHPSIGDHPENIVFLTCDALGVLPPVSKLTNSQAFMHFLNGYTAKVAGTEKGVAEPTLTFSACFGQPFLPLPPKIYAEMLIKRIERHSVKVWLVNTGWTGGAYGVGSRIKLSYTRAMLRAAFNGELEAAGFVVEPVFGLQVPRTCPGVPSELLMPRETWHNPQAYDIKASELRSRFEANSAKFI